MEAKKSRRMSEFPNSVGSNDGEREDMRCILQGDIWEIAQALRMRAILRRSAEVIIRFSWRQSLMLMRTWGKEMVD